MTGVSDVKLVISSTQQQHQQQCKYRVNNISKQCTYIITNTTSSVQCMSEANEHKQGAKTMIVVQPRMCRGYKIHSHTTLSRCYLPSVFTQLNSNSPNLRVSSTNKISDMNIELSYHKSREDNYYHMLL